MNYNITPEFSLRIKKYFLWGRDNRTISVKSKKSQILIMKFISIIILVANMHVLAKGVSQEKITLSLKDVPLEQAFNQIRMQTGFVFFYKKDIVENKRITVEVSNASVKEALDICLKGSSLIYTIIGKNIAIRKGNTIIEYNQKWVGAKLIDIKGRVIDENGVPANGVNIVVKGTKKGTSTNILGEFSLNELEENALLIITSVGYDRQEVSVANKTFINVQLKVAIGNLDELQVIAYGATTKRLNTGNIATVKASDIEKQPISNPLLSLQGRVPGLFITQANGLPGSGVKVTIQGQNSILKGNDPLYVIDGVPYVSQTLSTTLGGPLGSSGSLVINGVEQYGGGNPLNYINPSDIESIEILKDADATSIYGSRGANGAILISTKRGMAGKMKIDFNIQNGWGKVGRKLKLLNTRQYLDMRYEALKNDGMSLGTLTPSNTNYDLTFWDTTRSTDWQEELIGGTAQYNNISTRLYGGNSGVQYSIGSTFHRETSVFPGDFEDKKGSISFSLNSNSSNQRFKIQLSGNYLYDDNKLPQIDRTSTAITLPPVAPGIFNSDGSLNWAQTNSGQSTWTNPLSSIVDKNYNNKTKNLISNAIVAYRILPSLEIKSSFGYNSLQINEYLGNPLISNRPEQRASSVRTAIYTNNVINSWIIEPQIKYECNVWDGRLTALLGATIQQNSSTGQRFQGNGYNSDQVLEDIKSATTVSVTSTVSNLYKYNALFARINYNLLNKYLINLTGRRDGSSRFGPESQFHDFISTGFAWVFSEENVVKRNLKFITYGKLRGSYGTTGNDQIGDYQYINLFIPYNVGVPYQGISTLEPNRLTNPNLQWEETRKIQLGFELGVIKNRILITTNYFKNRSSNQLINYILPIISGFNGITKNIPATIQNCGWEISLNSTNVKRKNFSWNSNLNITLPRNKVVHFPDLEESSYSNDYKIGQPIASTSIYSFLGVDPSTGGYQFIDNQGNSTFTPDYLNDRTVRVTLDPKYYGGIQNTFTWSGIELDILFQFVKQIGPHYYFGNQPGRFNGVGNTGNQPAWVLDRWQKIGDEKSIMRFTNGSSLFGQWVNANSSSGGYSDASYIRLKNLSLTWQIPFSWIQKIHFQNIKLYLQSQNLLTITNYKGLDPETKSSTTLPPLRVITVGVRASL
jgi:TonB-dependent starch-binding outer membrane protein SusC